MADDAAQAKAIEPQGRIATIDIARGCAVLGILVINVTTIAGPGIASMTPDWHGHAGLRDWIAFITTWLLFEGKMRAIFATLFGASLALVLDRDDSPQAVLRQVRRLFWLGVFGYLHFLLFWWGDILFTYAIAGMIALLFRDLAPWRAIGLGLAAFVLVALIAAGEVWWLVDLSRQVVAGIASTEDAATVARFEQAVMAEGATRMAEYAMGFGEAIAYRLAEHPAFPFRMASDAVFEALPLMLIGMGLARSGFFAGRWRRRQLWLIAGLGGTVGLAWYGAMALYAAAQGFAITPVALFAFRFGMIGRLAMAASYLALLALFAQALAGTGLGRRLADAGRMAFSNYLGCTVLMTFLFHEWGLGLASREFGHATLMLFVALGWAAMLGWSTPWLARFGMGPLERLWRWLAGRRNTSPA